ncbi:hypothetical protein ACFSTD_08110 [Novosphingobium colocasiae]
MPANDELLLKIGQSLEFSRLGTPTQSRDTAMLAHYFTSLATARGQDQAAAFKAAERLRLAARLARSVDAVLDQHDADPLVVACGKLTLIHFLCQGEAKSILRLAPRVTGDLPIQGTESWLYQFGQLVTNGVPLSRVDSCLDAVSVISFCYDRSVEHFMPHALMMAFGMPFEEAQQLVSERLRIVHPYGTLGRLPWQSGTGPALEWGVEVPGDMQALVPGIRTGAQTLADTGLVAAMQAVVADLAAAGDAGVRLSPAQSGDAGGPAAACRSGSAGDHIRPERQRCCRSSPHPRSALRRARRRWIGAGKRARERSDARLRVAAGKLIGFSRRDS